MNKIINLILITSLVVCQNQNTQDVLRQIQNKAQSLHQNKNSKLENKFLQAKTLERSGLYEEALLLFKEINKSNPGNAKYFLPLKNWVQMYFDDLLKKKNKDIDIKYQF